MRQDCPELCIVRVIILSLKYNPKRGLGRIVSGDVMRALYGRDRRARRGRYFLRDLVGFAGVERLLANDAGGEHHSLDAAGDARAEAIASPVAPQPQGLRQEGLRQEGLRQQGLRQEGR
jgi:hypothetical protein